MSKRSICTALSAALLLPMLFTVPAEARSYSTGQTVDTVLFYVQDGQNRNVLLSHISTADMEKDLMSGKIDPANHNYAVLDRYVTPVHQEAKGWTIPDFVRYAQEHSTVEELKELPLTYTAGDQVAFWEMDQTDFDNRDVYSYEDLYGVPGYNFPLLYRFWNYRTQTYCDPDGAMTADEVIDHIFAGGERELPLLAVQSYSGRYMNVEDQFSEKNFNMENQWETRGLMDGDRMLRLMLPMTEKNLRDRQSTLSDGRFWISNILLMMEHRPLLAPLGETAAPTAVMTEDELYYYVRFSCETPDTLILYNHNFSNVSYTPTCAYQGEPVKIPKTLFPDGNVIVNCRGVRDGYTNPGITTLRLRATGTEHWTTPYTDVREGSWYYDPVSYVTRRGLVEGTGVGVFSPNQDMTRAMLVRALWKMEGAPHCAGSDPFTDLPQDPELHEAVRWAHEQQIVCGISPTLFQPEGTLTREQAATLFYRFAGHSAGQAPEKAVLTEGFADHTQVSAWAREAMGWAVEQGLIQGNECHMLMPQGVTSRAQASAMLQRLEKSLGGMGRSFT